ncbi:MAG: type II toxin-antitoxin system Phd/YefM family antitoxin [Spirochaetaceae bacterium]|jgi:PHD/YefM family antitoxin component YafN of YafNO toxin-antitoxin module|nr:type II toxin-antitoxin system Phd/YefM family antitoxin [Spirochaetaceae bacterium]
MPTIRPLSDLKTDLAEIAETAHLTKEPVFLTEKGYGSFVLIDMKTWQDQEWQRGIEQKLKESEAEIKSSGFRWLTEEEIYGPIDKMLDELIAANPEALEKERNRDVQNA